LWTTEKKKGKKNFFKKVKNLSFKDCEHFRECPVQTDFSNSNFLSQFVVDIL
jgi:hypothetical protein